MLLSCALPQLSIQVAIAKQNRQAGNTWMLTARTRAARRLPQPRKRFDGSVWGLKDEFTLANFFF